MQNQGGSSPGADPGSGAGRPQQRGPMVQPTTPGETHPVDARGQPNPNPAEHVIADYFNDKPSPRDGAPAPTLQQGVHDAAKGVEKAIEQQSVPSQYSDLVRRVFRRYVDRVQPATGAPKPSISPDAPDARAR